MCCPQCWQAYAGRFFDTMEFGLHPAVEVPDLVAAVSHLHHLIQACVIIRIFRLELRKGELFDNNQSVETILARQIIKQLVS